MKWHSLAVLLFPIALVAGADAQPGSPAAQAESWVTESLRVARTKGLEVLLAEVQNPKGRFTTGHPEADPELWIYSGRLEVLALNRVSRHVKMDHSRQPDAVGSPILKKMQAFAQASGPGWLEYLGTDSSGHPKPFKAYVALQGSNLIAAVIPR
jgi:hypothetical protein